MIAKSALFSFYALGHNGTRILLVISTYPD